VVLTRSNPGYSAGYVYYVDGRKALLATSMDVSNGRVAGEPRVVAEGVGYQPSTYRGAFTAAENGSVVYNADSGAVLSVLTWVDRAGKELGRVGDPGVLANPTISPDGSRVAVNITDVRANNVDIWTHDLKSGNRSRFTFNPAEEVSASWSRDGSTVAFYRSSVGQGNVFLKKALGLEPEKFILRISGDPYPNSWTLDDQAILCTLQVSGTPSSLVLVPASGGQMTPFLAAPDNKTSESNGQISPDGKWVAYASNESGDWEIYVTTFPSAVGKWQVSRGGGTEPRWRGDGKEIFYIGAKGTLTAVLVSTEGTFSTGTATSLFQIRGRVPISSSDLFTYDVAKDGKRFLVNRYVKPEHIKPLTILLHAAGNPQ
jgi:Tol biopolymer transport system component